MVKTRPESPEKKAKAVSTARNAAPVARESTAVAGFVVEDPDTHLGLAPVLTSTALFQGLKLPVQLQSALEEHV